MRIEIKQDILFKAINTVQRGITNNSHLSILDGILIEAIDGKLKLTGSNLELTIENLIDCNIIEEGSIVVESKLFGNVIRSLYDDKIEIYAKGTNVNIKCGTAFFNINGKDATQYPTSPKCENNEVLKIKSEVFKNMIRQTIFATAQNDVMSTLSGAFFEVKDNQVSLVSLDRYRLAVKRESIEFENHKRVVIPAKTLNELGKIIDGNIDYINISFSKNHILFNIGNILVTYILLEGEYVDYTRFLCNEFNSKVTVNKRLFQDSIERAVLLNKEQGFNAVSLEVEYNLLKIQAQSNIGKFEDKLKILLEGSNIAITFNSRYLLEGLRVIDSDYINLCFTSSVGPCIIKPKEDEAYTYLVLPTKKHSNKS